MGLTYSIGKPYNDKCAGNFACAFNNDFRKTMKKTCFLAMLAAALMGGQVFAEPTGTTIEGGVKIDDKYYGAYSKTESVTGGNVTVKEEATGEVPVKAVVYGGCSDEAAASNNTVTMQGGTVQSIYGGNGYTGASNNTVIMKDGTVSNIRSGNGGTYGNAYNNTVIMTGGNVNMLYGGSSGNNYTASGNVVIVTGGSITSALLAGCTFASDAKNNKVHLVGKGASNVKIADAQEAISTYGYTGVDAGISFANVYGGYAPQGTSSGNSIDIYGTGITITKQLQYVQILTFNITDGQMTGQNTEAALSLTTTATSLDGVDLQIKDLDVKEWTTGKTITLVQSEQAIQGLGDGKMVDIMKDGQAVARGQLVLSNDDKTLSLNVQGSVPEPATGTLGVFALAALAARRRKK